MEVVPAIFAIALVYQAVNLVRYAMAKDVSSVVTILVAAAAGVGIAFLFANSGFGDQIPVAGKTLDDLNGSGLVVAGLSFAAAAGAFVDYKTKQSPPRLLGQPGEN